MQFLPKCPYINESFAMSMYVFFTVPAHSPSSHHDFPLCLIDTSTVKLMLTFGQKQPSSTDLNSIIADGNKRLFP